MTDTPHVSSMNQIQVDIKIYYLNLIVEQVLKLRHVQYSTHAIINININSSCFISKSNVSFQKINQPWHLFSNGHYWLLYYLYCNHSILNILSPFYLCGECCINHHDTEAFFFKINDMMVFFKYFTTNICLIPIYVYIYWICILYNPITSKLISIDSH